jgi:hypothetical protein
VVFYDASGYRLVDVNTASQGRFLSLRPGEEAQISFTLENVLLKPGTYLVGLWLGRGAVDDIDGILYATTLDVEVDAERLRHSEIFPGPYQCEFSHRVDLIAAPATDGTEPGRLFAATGGVSP